MKCPECGFVSFPGLERCKKCGHLLTQLPGEPKDIPPLFYISRKTAKAPAMQDSDPGQHSAEAAGRSEGELDIELKPDTQSPKVSQASKVQPAPAPEQPEAGQDWQSELAERVQEYRQRRARLRQSENNGQDTLNLDLGVSPPELDDPRPNVIEFPSAEELERQSKPAASLRSASRSAGLENFESSFKDQRSGIASASRPKAPPADEAAPLQIEMGTSNASLLAGIRASEPSGSGVASMSSRIFAGLLDALVLLSGTALFALIFWRTGGVFTMRPGELVAAGVIGVFFTLLYFAGCTALSSATPGLMWAGLEVTTFEGNLPGLSESMWRAFGYLVSISALMLGFIWAVVDADSLTWHDRMSRTIVVPSDHQ